MKAEDIDLASWLEFRWESGQLLLNGRRMTIFAQDAMGILRELVVGHVGMEFAAAIFAQFGFRCGQDDYHAIAADGQWDTELDRIRSGPIMHMWEGIVEVSPTALQFDRATGDFFMSGIWRHSYEAEVHIGAFGRSDAPVCWSLTGYASGWASEFFGADLLAIETSCIGVGDDVCTFEIRPEARWDNRADPWRRALVATSESVTSRMETLVAERTRQLSASNDRLEAARDAAERANEVKSRFLANVSHELRTPLNGVLGLAAVLADTDLTDEQRLVVDKIIAAADQQAAIVDDLLDYTNMESGAVTARFQPVDVADVVRQVVASHAPAAATGEVSLQTSIPEHASGWITDPLLLRQLLSALVGNAVKFTAPGGEVEVTCRLRADHLALDIHDTGMGLAGDINGYFEPFTLGDDSRTRRHGGAGLGLALVRDVAELIGAQVQVESTPGVGSTFTVLLPEQPEPGPLPHSDAPGTAAAAIPASSPALPSESADAAPPGAPTESDEETPLRALIADDNEINAVVLQRLLETLGCEVTAVADGLAATECFDEAAFDLIVLDLHMPVLDGLGAVRHIRDAETERGLSRHLVAALTADAMDETRARCLAAGFSEFLTKPVRKELLSELVNKAARFRAARAATEAGR